MKKAPMPKRTGSNAARSVERSFTSDRSYYELLCRYRARGTRAGNEERRHRAPCGQREEGEENPVVVEGRVDLNLPTRLGEIVRADRRIGRGQRRDERHERGVRSEERDSGERTERRTAERRNLQETMGQQCDGQCIE